MGTREHLLILLPHLHAFFLLFHLGDFRSYPHAWCVKP